MVALVFLSTFVILVRVNDESGKPFLPGRPIFFTVRNPSMSPILRKSENGRSYRSAKNMFNLGSKITLTSGSKVTLLSYWRFSGVLVTITIRNKQSDGLITPRSNRVVNLQNLTSNEIEIQRLLNRTQFTLSFFHFDLAFCL